MTTSSSFFEIESSKKSADIGEANVGEIRSVENAVQNALMPIQGSTPLG